MPRPTYTVFTLVTCSLVFVGATVILLKPFVPKAPMNQLGHSKEEFLLQGAYEPIQWRTLGDDAFLEARKSGRPILLYIGAPWSSLSRQIDDDAFEDSTIQRLLARDFVCVRVDGMRHQDWLNALLPVSRLTTRFLPGVQLWVLDPRGRVLVLISQVDANQMFDHNTMVEMLVNARNVYEKVSDAGSGYGFVAGSTQRADLAAVANADRMMAPALQTVRDLIASKIDPKFGGFSQGGLQSLSPSAWRYLELAGDWDSLAASLDPVVISPMDDLLDGGFYRLSLVREGYRVRFDKLTTANAEMLTLLASAAQLRNDPAYEALARRTWNYLTEDVYKDGVFATCRLGDEGPDGRSQRSSFSPRMLRSLLPPEDRNWAESNMGLVVGDNPLMSPYPVAKSVLSENVTRLDAILSELKGAHIAPIHLAGLGELGTSAFTVARLIETSRMWKDPNALEFALGASDGLETFRLREKESRISPFVSNEDFSDDAIELRPDTYDVTTESLLPDYLSYADAMLQCYLATGRIIPLEDGIRTLRVALHRFRPTQGLGSNSESYGDPAGIFLMAQQRPHTLGVVDSDSPEIADNTQESCTAQLIRLCLSYGHLVSGTQVGQEFLTSAYAAIGRFSQITSAGSPLCAGYYCSALMGQDDRYAIAVGPKAQQMADDLFARVPTRFVAPAFGEVRPDLQARKPGIYIMRSGDARGPFTVEEAASLLPSYYDLEPMRADTPTPKPR